MLFEIVPICLYSRLAMVIVPTVLTILAIIQWLSFYLYNTKFHLWSYILEVSSDSELVNDKVQRRHWGDILRYDAVTGQPMEVGRTYVS